MHYEIDPLVPTAGIPLNFPSEIFTRQRILACPIAEKVVYISIRARKRAWKFRANFR